MAIRLDMIGLVVKDMAASLQFYRLLGMAIPEGVEGEPFVEVTTPEGYRVSWNTQKMVKGIDPDWTEPTGHRMGLAFLCDSPADVDRVYAELTAQGFHGHKAPWDAFWGQRYAIVDDPDGNHVDLFAPLSDATEPAS